MRRTVAIVLALVAAPVVAEDFGPRFKEGYEKLRAGDPGAALASFQNLLTETPDSELVQYSIAAAEYEVGLKNFETGDLEAAVESLNRARSQFDELHAAQTPFVREQSRFSSANSIAQIGKHLDENQAYKERVDALSAAVQAYETFLAEYPDHEAAATNLNHTSYLLKKMLQQPPPDQQKSENDEGDGENQDQSQQGDQGQQPQPNEDEESDQQQDDDASSDQGQDNQPQDQASQNEKTEDQNIEAILQSLEDKNQQEQKNLRKAKEAPRVRDGKWW